MSVPPRPRASLRPSPSGLVALALLAAGCGGASGGGGGVHDVVVVSGDVTSTTTWRAGHLYRVQAPVVVSARLTVDPGVTVQLDPGVGLEVRDGGAIIADGRSAETPVVFTSSAAAPAPGDWAGIAVRGSGSTFSFCEVRYAGAKDVPALSLAAGSSATVTRCTFAHHRTSSGALSAPAALDASSAASTTVLRGNVFYGNVVPLAIDPALSVDDASTFTDGTTGNAHQAIVVRGCGHVVGNALWRARSVPFLVGTPGSACNDLRVDDGSHLTIGPDVTVKFLPHAAVTVAAGAQLTAEPTDWLTSWRDDHAGDTNGDGAATSPAPRDWYGVKRLRSGSADPVCDDGVYLHYQTPNDAANRCTW